jgi:hypothetical protein
MTRLLENEASTLKTGRFATNIQPQYDVKILERLVAYSSECYVTSDSPITTVNSNRAVGGATCPLRSYFYERGIDRRRRGSTRNLA